MILLSDTRLNKKIKIKMKAYKIEILVIDNENIGEESIKEYIKNAKYIYPSILSIKSKEIGDWSDDHPLNKKETFFKTAKDLFNHISHEKLKEWIEDQEYYLGSPEDIGDGQHFEYYIQPHTLEQLIELALEELS